MKLHAFGVRGSLPSPSTKGFKTSAYGGNTTCYYLEAGPFRIILDMGSGARVLGNILMSKGIIGKSFIFLLTHHATTDYTHLREDTEYLDECKKDLSFLLHSRSFPIYFSHQIKTTHK